VRISVGLLFTAFALSGAATGCGGGGGGAKPLTKDALVAQATPICRSANKQANKLRVREQPKNRQQAIHNLASALTLDRRMVNELRQLAPPSQIRSKWANYLRLQQQAITTARQGLRELRNGQIDSFRSSMKASGELDGRAGDIVYALGIHSCAPY
jgi:hypothetical protein